MSYRNGVKSGTTIGSVWGSVRVIWLNLKAPVELTSLRVGKTNAAGRMSDIIVAPMRPNLVWNKRYDCFLYAAHLEDATSRTMAGSVEAARVAIMTIKQMLDWFSCRECRALGSVCVVTCVYTVATPLFVEGLSVYP